MKPTPGSDWLLLLFSGPPQKNSNDTCGPRRLLSEKILWVRNFALLVPLILNVILTATIKNKFHELKFFPMKNYDTLLSFQIQEKTHAPNATIRYRKKTFHS